jgi:hypothetical protein
LYAIIADVAIIAQDREELFGVEALAQGRGRDDVDEQDRELAPFRAQG